eukprot:5159303-Amphidinium_carterae.1
MRQLRKTKRTSPFPKNSKEELQWQSLFAIIAAQGFQKQSIDAHDQSQGMPRCRGDRNTVVVTNTDLELYATPTLRTLLSLMCVPLFCSKVTSCKYVNETWLMKQAASLREKYGSRTAPCHASRR